jgi:hypothetical protein
MRVGRANGVEEGIDGGEDCGVGAYIVITRLFLSLFTSFSFSLTTLLR